MTKQTVQNPGTPITRDFPERLKKVARSIEAGRLGEARQALEGCVGDPLELIELMRLKLSVAERRLEPSSALTSVIAFLRKEPGHPAALALYQEFSMLQYQAGQSSLSHSHPPPPDRAR